MIENLCDVLERRFSKMFVHVAASLANRTKKVVAHFETSLADQDKDKMRKAFCRFFWSWSLLIWKRFV